MALTSAQKTTLKNAILADSTLNAFPNTSDGNFDLCAQKLNVAASPAFIIWNPQFTMSQARSGIVSGITQLDNLTQGKRDALLYLVRDTIDMTVAAVRQAIDDLTGSQNTLKNALTDAGKKSATLGEKILSTGTGSQAVPAVPSFTGNLSPDDVQQARSS